MSIEWVMPSNHFILCHPLLLLSSIFLSIRVFSNESVLCIRWPKCWSFSIHPSNEYTGLISFRTDFTSFQSKRPSRVFSNTTDQKLQFFSTQLSLWSNFHIHTWLLEIALTIRNFVSKVMSLLFNMLSKFVIAFFPRSKYLNFMAAVTISLILEPKKRKSLTVSVVSPSTCHEVMGPDAHTLHKKEM